LNSFPAFSERSPDKLAEALIFTSELKNSFGGKERIRSALAAFFQYIVFLNCGVSL